VENAEVRGGEFSLQYSRILARREDLSSSTFVLVLVLDRFHFEDEGRGRGVWLRLGRAAVLCVLGVSVLLLRGIEFRLRRAVFSPSAP
jgi:hypothetical protein